MGRIPAAYLRPSTANHDVRCYTSESDTSDNDDERECGEEDKSSTQRVGQKDPVHRVSDWPALATASHEIRGQITEATRCKWLVRALAEPSFVQIRSYPSQTDVHFSESHHVEMCSVCRYLQRVLCEMSRKSSGSGALFGTYVTQGWQTIGRQHACGMRTLLPPVNRKWRMCCGISCQKEQRKLPLNGSMLMLLPTTSTSRTHPYILLLAVE